MTSAFLLAVALTCSETKMVNITEEPWSAYDYEMRDKAKARCGELYKDSPCLHLFRKYNHQQYSAICGEEEHRSRPGKQGQ